MSGIIQNALNQTSNEFNQALAKQKGSTLDKDSFMLLLVTQFKYQDPLNPMDDKEFISQMAQFSSLEQMMNMNESMEKQTEAINNQQMIGATSYIGKQVSVAGNTIGKITDGNTGEVTVSTFRYAFGDNVVKGTLAVRDASGNTVYTEDLAGKQAGTTFEFSWNGRNGAGMPCPDGVYQISLSAFNENGEAVLSDQVVDATVTGVVNQEGTIYLGMDGGQLMSLADVRQVSTPKVVATNTENKKEETPQLPVPPAADSGAGAEETPQPPAPPAADSGAGAGEGDAGGGDAGDAQNPETPQDKAA